MKLITEWKTKKLFKASPSFVPAGQSTQLIIGASPESDYSIINLSEKLYNKLNLKRVYYSAYIPVSNNPMLSKIRFSPLLREHRLYQAGLAFKVLQF